MAGSARAVPHDFHMTIGFLRADVHGATKDETTLIEHALALEPEPEPEPKMILSYWNQFWQR